jgi:hypothetical protein
MEELIKVLDTTNNEEFYISKNTFDKIEEAINNGTILAFNGLVKYLEDDTSVFKRYAAFPHDKNRFKIYDEKES